MSNVLKFTEETITDQKRLVRGEHLLYARSCLRARDATHNAKWRVLMLAGGAPRGEVTAIRSLMPKAQIIAVDQKPECLTAAIEAGVDDVIECDLMDWGYEVKNGGKPLLRAAKAITDQPQFDLMVLDLCTNVTPALKDFIPAYRRHITKDGVFIVTFSYGRDVSELFQCRHPRHRELEDLRLPDAALARLNYLLSDSLVRSLHAIALYRGAAMPMCSLLFTTGPYDKRPRAADGYGYVPSVVCVEPGDFEVAVVYPDAMALYDCPQHRIESLRRKFAALKASFTRKDRNKDTLF